MTLFPFGGFKLIMKDFEGPNMEDEEVKEALHLKQQRWLFLWKRDGRKNGRRPPVPESLIEEGKKDARDNGLQCILSARQPTFDGFVETNHEVPGQRAHNRLHKHHVNPRRVSFQPDSSEDSPTTLHAAFNSAAPTVVARTEDGTETPPSSPIVEDVSDSASSSTPALVSLFSKLLSYLRTLPGPVTITLLVAFVIAIVTPLKALFVPLIHEDGTPIILFAPDGAPPLSFLLDTATFLGNASVPLGLVCIGAAFAKLRIPKRVKDLPLGAISALAIGRLILQPVVGVFMTQGLVRVGAIHEDDKVLRFLVMSVALALLAGRFY